MGLAILNYYQSVCSVFLFLAFSLTLARTSSTMLNRGDESGHFCFVSFSFSLLSMMLAAGYHVEEVAFSSYVAEFLL